MAEIYCDLCLTLCKSSDKLKKACFNYTFPAMEEKNSDGFPSAGLEHGQMS